MNIQRRRKSCVYGTQRVLSNKIENFGNYVNCLWYSMVFSNKSCIYGIFKLLKVYGHFTKSWKIKGTFCKLVLKKPFKRNKQTLHLLSFPSLQKLLILVALSAHSITLWLVVEVLTPLSLARITDIDTNTHHLLLPRLLFTL